MGAADDPNAGLGKAKVPDLALSDQLLHRAGDVLDRDVRIDAMLVEQVDGVDAESLARGLGDTSNLLRPAVEADGLAGVRVDLPSELRGDHHASTERLQRLADEFLVDVRAVDLGGVEDVIPRSTAVRVSEIASCLSIGG
jgi:hypothetical protein